MNFKFSAVGFTVLLALAILPTGCKPKATDETSPDQVIAKAGYKVYGHKDPYYIFVSDKYPANQSMMLLSDPKSSKSRLIAFDFNDDDDDAVNPSRTASVSFVDGIDSRIKFGRDGKPQELSLLLTLPNQPEQFLRDVNLDGTWDIKILPSAHKQFIFLNSQWYPVNKVGGHWPDIKAESSQGSFIFDMKTGQWARQEKPNR